MCKNGNFTLLHMSIWSGKRKVLSNIFGLQNDKVGTCRNLLQFVPNTLRITLQMDMCKNGNFTFLHMSIWDRKTKGGSITFWTPKWQSEHMSKSSVKRKQNRMTFWTKSDEMVHFRKSAPTPMDSPFLATWAISEIDQKTVLFGHFHSRRHVGHSHFSKCASMPVYSQCLTQF